MKAETTPKREKRRLAEGVSQGAGPMKRRRGSFRLEGGKPGRNPILLLGELFAVLALTAAAFKAGTDAALECRGCGSQGGEYLLLLLPALYYLGKQTAADWLADLREHRRPPPDCAALRRMAGKALNRAGKKQAIGESSPDAEK